MVFDRWIDAATGQVLQYAGSGNSQFLIPSIDQNYELIAEYRGTPTTVCDVILSGDSVVPPTESEALGRLVVTRDTENEGYILTLKHNVPDSEEARIHIGGPGTNGSLYQTMVKDTEAFYYTSLAEMQLRAVMDNGYVVVADAEGDQIRGNLNCGWTLELGIEGEGTVTPLGEGRTRLSTSRTSAPRRSSSRFRRTARQPRSTSPQGYPREATPPYSASRRSSSRCMTPSPASPPMLTPMIRSIKATPRVCTSAA
jgi:hypothetical protein